MFNIFSIWWWASMMNWAGTISVLLLNAVLILSDERFLARLDLAVPRPFPQTAGQVLINRSITLLNALRRPARAMLIPANFLIILVQLLAG